MLQRTACALVLTVVAACLVAPLSVLAQTYPRNVTPTSIDRTLDPAVHDIVLVTTAANQIKITLPPIAGNTGRHFTVKKVDGPPLGTGAVTIQPNLTDTGVTIDGQASYTLLNQHQEVRVVSDGTRWRVLDALSQKLFEVPTLAGANAGEKMRNAALACAATGCILDGRGFGRTPQTISSDPFMDAGNLIDKPFTWYLGSATYNLDNGSGLTPSISVPSHLRVMGEGATLLAAPGGKQVDPVEARGIFDSIIRRTTGTISAGSRVLTVSSAAGIEAGSLLGIVGFAAAGNNLPPAADNQTGTLNAALSCGLTPSLTITGTAGGWMRGSGDAFISSTVSGVLLIGTELIGYGNWSTNGVNTIFTSLTRNYAGTTCPGGGHPNGALVRQVLLEYVPVVSVSGTTVVLEEALSSTLPYSGLTNTNVLFGPHDISFEGRLTIDCNHYHQIQTICRGPGCSPPLNTNEVKIVTTRPHGLSVNNTFSVHRVSYSGVTPFNGGFTVTFVDSATQFRYSQTGEDGAGAGGVVGRSDPSPIGPKDPAFASGLILDIARNVRIGPDVKVKNCGFFGLMLDPAYDSVSQAEIEGMYDWGTVNLWGRSKRNRILGKHRSAGDGPTIEARSVTLTPLDGPGEDNYVAPEELNDIEQAGAQIESGHRNTVYVPSAQAMQQWGVTVYSEQWSTNLTPLNNTVILGSVTGPLTQFALDIDLTAANGNNTAMVLSPLPAGKISISPGNSVFYAGGAGTGWNVAGVNGSALGFLQVSEQTTIAAAPFTDTAIQIPANAVVLAVSVRVDATIPIPGATPTFDVGVPGVTTRYGAGLSAMQGTTNPGSNDGARFYAVATPIRITPSATPPSASGRVRVVIFYYLPTAPSQ